MSICTLLHWFIAIIALHMSKQIQITLKSEQTCLEYLVQQPNQSRHFYFHFNPNFDNVNMILYHKGVKQIWHETGFGFEYKTTLQVEYKEAGNYTICFKKKSAPDADVSFEVVKSENQHEYVGKQQVAKLSRRISQFLMDIKKVGWTFKQVLEQYNTRKQLINKQQKSYFILLAVKTLVMIGIVTIQILVVKRILK